VVAHPLPFEVAHLLVGLGLPLIQGYGLTETSPVISVNPLENNYLDSVGVPLPGMEVRLGADSELQVKGPGVMLGYWNNPEATAAVLDANGWLRTGDQARIAGQHLYITGRIKDIMVLSNGEKVSPADLEMAIGLDPLFEQVMIVGEGQPFLAALARPGRAGLAVPGPGIWPGSGRQGQPCQSPAAQGHA
jgi:long-chain acyl-CoA synthetase